MPTKTATAMIPGVTNPQSELIALEATSQVQAVSLSRPPASKQRSSARNKATAAPKKIPQMTAREWLQPHLVPVSITANVHNEGRAVLLRASLSTVRISFRHINAPAMPPMASAGGPYTKIANGPLKLS